MGWLYLEYMMTVQNSTWKKKKIIKFPPSWPKPEKKNPIKIGATSFIDPFSMHVNNNMMEKVALY